MSDPHPKDVSSSAMILSGTKKLQNISPVQTLNLNAGSTSKMYHFHEENIPIQETLDKMSFEFKWRVKEAKHPNPCKYGHVQAADSMLKLIHSNLKDIKDWEILDSSAIYYFTVTDAPAIGIIEATNPITVTIPDASNLTRTNKKDETFHNCQNRHHLATLSKVSHYKNSPHYAIWDVK